MACGIYAEIFPRIWNQISVMPAPLKETFSQLDFKSDSRSGLINGLLHLNCFGLMGTSSIPENSNCFLVLCILKGMFKLPFVLVFSSSWNLSAFRFRFTPLYFGVSYTRSFEKLTFANSIFKFATYSSNSIIRLWLAKRDGIHKVQHRFSDILDFKITI